jgi:hypothetical protein
MAKTTLPQRAKKYADNFSAAPDLTLQHAACAGFRAGFEAHKRDVRPTVHDLEDECRRRFYYLSKTGLWEDYQARKEQGDFEFVRGIKRKGE